MNQQTKDYTSTIMRMAGNIAAGFVSGRNPRKIDAQDVNLIADMSLLLAQLIVRKAQE